MIARAKSFDKTSRRGKKNSLEIDLPKILNIEKIKYN
jgi:hypothetical protein